MPKLLVVLVVAGNAEWTIASIALLFSGAASPNLLGEIVVVAQAIATGVFADRNLSACAKAKARWRPEPWFVPSFWDGV